MEWWASDWCLAWQPGCDVAWTAWAAIGSLASALAAIWVTWFHVRREARAKDRSDRVVLRHLCMDATEIYHKTKASLGVLRRHEQGLGMVRIDVGLLRLIKDAQLLGTPCYDAFGARLIEMDVDSVVAVASCFLSVKKEVAAIEMYASENLTFATLHRIRPHFQNINNAAKQVVIDIGSYLGDDVGKALAE